MYHSVAFGNKNTWDDFHLVPSSKPIILPPEVKTKIVDIPGGDGVIDLTESLTGYPVFGNRAGSFTFIVVDDSTWLMDQHISWEESYQKLLSYIHGRKMKVVLEDDPKWYYEGRLTIADPKQYKNYSGVTVEFDLGPYKWDLRDSQNAVGYDPFGAYTDVAPDTTFVNLAVSTTPTEFIFDETQLGIAPVSPYFNVSSTAGAGIILEYTDVRGDTREAAIPNGIYGVNDLIFSRNATLSMSCEAGTATVSIQFRKGTL